MREPRDYWSEAKEDFSKAKEEFKVFKSEAKEFGKAAGSYLSTTGKKMGIKIKAFLNDKGVEKLLLAGGLITGVGLVSSGLLSNEALRTLLGAGISGLFGALSIKFIKKRKENESDEHKENQTYRSYESRTSNTTPYGWQNKYDESGRRESFYNVDPQDIHDGNKESTRQKPKMQVFDIDEDERDF